MLHPLVQIEVKKLCDAKLIISVKYSKWVANLLLVGNKNEEIMLYIDLRNLNRTSLKYDYPLPNMDQMLQKVVGSERMSMLDGFSRYNYVNMDLEDVLNTTFTTLWGIFSYVGMPFRLVNVGATFQRAMDYSFVDITFIFIVIYLDELIFYFKKVVDHLEHITQIFERYKKFGISLNLEKYFFGMV
jgi:hypothetical protein